MQDYGGFMGAVQRLSLLWLAITLSPAYATTSQTPAGIETMGTWSFDGTCASGDGMQLQYDGKASYDEWGRGLWALADGGQRLVIIVEDIREGADRRPIAELIEFRILHRRPPQGMTLERASDGAKIEAKRCAG
jgi:hypothetical protein